MIRNPDSYKLPQNEVAPHVLPANASSAQPPSAVPSNASDFLLLPSKPSGRNPLVDRADEEIDNVQPTRQPPIGFAGTTQSKAASLRPAAGFETQPITATPPNLPQNQPPPPGKGIQQPASSTQFATGTSQLSPKGAAPLDRSNGAKSASPGLGDHLTNLAAGMTKDILAMSPASQPKR